jgi:GrpB-like predicted nucleotidyltransferase (UPF0157 family)
VPDRVVAYDPIWPERYEGEAERLRDRLGAIAVAIEHVGSTAVPGIAAKPTIDIAVGVRQLDDVGPEQVAAMEELDYVYRGEAGVRGRHYFRKGATYPRDFHVSIVEWGGPLWQDYLLLRGYLRRRPEEATAYVEAKRAAESATAGRDPITYWEHKHSFVEAMLERARREPDG